MVALDIKKYPNPILRKKTEKVKEITPEIKKLSRDMTETMEKNNGVGLAAPQVGVLKRVIAVQNGAAPFILINPKITEKSWKKEIAEEGCLSLPGTFLEIKRAKRAGVEGLDINGKKLQIKAEGLIARVLQHEIDHLNGILIIDK